MLHKFRIAGFLLVAAAVMAAPALNCLSFMDQMNMQQMACCKQMQLDDSCDMGVGHQPCCGHGASQTLRAALPDKVGHIHAVVVSVGLIAEIVQHPQAVHATFHNADNGSPPLEPPGNITVLRI